MARSWWHVNGNGELEEADKVMEDTKKLAETIKVKPRVFFFGGRNVTSSTAVC